MLIYQHPITCVKVPYEFRIFSPHFYLSFRVQFILILLQINVPYIYQVLHVYSLPRFSVGFAFRNPIKFKLSFKLLPLISIIRIWWVIQSKFLNVHIIIIIVRLHFILIYVCIYDCIILITCHLCSCFILITQILPCVRMGFSNRTLKIYLSSSFAQYITQPIS